MARRFNLADFIRKGLLLTVDQAVFFMAVIQLEDACGGQIKFAAAQLELADLGFLGRTVVLFQLEQLKDELPVDHGHIVDILIRQDFPHV